MAALEQYNYDLFTVGLPAAAGTISARGYIASQTLSRAFLSQEAVPEPNVNFSGSVFWSQNSLGTRGGSIRGLYEIDSVTL